MEVGNQSPMSIKGNPYMTVTRRERSYGEVFQLNGSPKGLFFNLLLTYNNHYYCITFAEFSNEEVYFILFRSVFDQS